MSATAIEPATQWNAVLTDICWVCEWAERFPNEATDKALDWARSEIARIGKHLDSLPEEFRIEFPNVQRYEAAMDAVS